MNVKNRVGIVRERGNYMQHKENKKPKKIKEKKTKNINKKSNGDTVPFISSTMLFTSSNDNPAALLSFITLDNSSSTS